MMPQGVADWVKGPTRLAAVAVFAACAGGPAAPTNRTFYARSVDRSDTVAFETPYPRLNWPTDAEPEFMGVEILQGAVRFSRPRRWLVRAASNEPGAAYVNYVSPHAYSFAVYERHAQPSDSWADILARYESGVEAAGARVLGRRIPIATSVGQGRAYSIQTPVDPPEESRSREMLVRGEQRLVLIQVVHQEENLAAFDHELLRAVGTLEVH